VDALVEGLTDVGVQQRAAADGPPAVSDLTWDATSERFGALVDREVERAFA
jgi:hypothetical protein